jgi:iron complex outermembrane receptor protein
MHMKSRKQTGSAVSRLLSLALVLPLAALAQTTSGTTTTDETVVLEKFTIQGMKSFSDQAIEGKTPVSFTEIGKDIITAELGSQDIPLVLNSTPSVFATTDGGAAGDARVNVRGFSQRNVSILINGVPTNDVENGWLYWSNWDGLGDVTSTIQVQRGLSNVTLPTPSIGGTMNVITDPAAAKRGGSVRLEMGTDSFLKATAVLNTGMLKDKFALTVGAVRKVGDGNPRGAWSDASGYYIGSTWVVNDLNRLEFFAIGSPQQHGQRRFASNIAAYDAAFARSLGYTDAQITAAMAVGPVNAGQDYNQNYAPVATTYSGQQYYWGGLHDRYDDNMMNESVNYFHKPQVNVNWYLTPNDRLSVTTVFYYSGGRGGGSGTLNNGSSSAAFGRYPNSNVPWGSNIDWNRTIASNAGAVAANGSAKTAGRSLGILRNSVNNQDQFGIVSKLTYELTPEFKFTTGVDWRTAEIAHYREVRDLLGGSYYLPTTAQASEFWATGTTTQLKLGDKVDYFNTNTVDWLGLFAQGQYEKGPITAFGVVGYSNISYGFVDDFRRAAPGSSESFSLDKDGITGNQFKGGVNYEFNQNFNAFMNLGVVSKVPNFDGAINDVSGVLVNAPNEKFKSGEVGMRFETTDQKFNVSASYYYTQWRERSYSTYNQTTDVLTYLFGVDQNYSGLEVEAAWQPKRWMRFDLAASFGNWTYIRDVAAEAFDGDGDPVPTSGMVYLNGLKVGDAPQTQIAIAATFYPVQGLSIKLQGRSYDRYYADFDPSTRQNSADRGQAWQLPNYEIYDLHVNYLLPLKNDRFDLTVFAHVFNLTDELYISDATDNSGFEAISSAPSHSPQRAEVFLGPPISYNLGVSLKF